MTDSQNKFLTALPDKFTKGEAKDLASFLMLSSSFCDKTLAKMTLSGHIKRTRYNLYLKEKC